MAVPIATTEFVIRPFNVSENFFVYNASENFTDTDLQTGDKLTYSIEGAEQFPSLSIDPVTGIVTGDLPASTRNNIQTAYNTFDPAVCGGNVECEIFYTSERERDVARVLAELQIKIVATDTSGNSAFSVLSFEATENNTPIITSNDGGLAGEINVAENSTFVTTVTANDANNDSLVYSLAGGADVDKFVIDAQTGALSFVNVPDFESRTDSGQNNIYDVIVEVSDGVMSDIQKLAITVTDIAENVGVEITSNAFTITGTNQADVLTGLNGSNRLLGLDGDDKLTGGGGSDLLDGGRGADAMAGGRGDDIYCVDNAGDTVTEAFGQGTDTVFTTLNKFLLASNVENLAFSGEGGFSGQGNALANIIVGGSGNDLLDGGSGSDALFGGRGDDVYIVDTNKDEVVEFASGGNDTVRVVGESFYTLSRNVENLTYIGNYAGIDRFTANGNSLANVITGGNGEDRINGANGNDTLLGLDGADQLSGGAGADILVGGTGNDRLTGDAGNDVFVFAPGFGRDRITDFDANPNGGQDAIDLRALGITSRNYTSRVSVTDIGSSVLIKIDGDVNQTIQLDGVSSIAQITQLDFFLA